MTGEKHHRPFGPNDLYPERPVTIGLRMPHQLPGGAAGLRDFAAAAEAAGIDRVFTSCAAEAGRPVTGWRHGMHVWCGIGASPEAARPGLAAAMEGFYGIGFGKFERYSPCGTPRQIAAALRPYLDAGCRSFNLIPVADGEQAAIEGAAMIGEELR